MSDLAPSLSQAPVGRIEPGFLVDTDWLAANLDRPDLRLFDCSATMHVDPVIQQRVHPERDAFEAAHIAGARFIDIDAQLSDHDHPVHLMLPPREAFASAMAALGISNDSLVVIYSTGNIWWATRVWWMLRVYGFDHAHILDGGLQKWRAEGRPVATGPSAPPAPGHFTASAPRALVADRQAVLAAIGDAGTRIVNALRPPQYSGAEAPRKGRPGHIASSVNVPAASLLDPATGCLLDDAALRAAFVEAGVTPAQRVVAYCGGGVSASLVVFALTKLAHPDVRLYDASLGEWASDPTLPMQIEPA
ncbi:sulfurtransferase [Chitinasiproducens palmae]|uniref:Thiosulfate/3-mercaptopyruvate sulfurtransferase n=1 Tax=Chitinasiproducens palmae TaxID=1770053 RepID=A0A1H2PW17_9BURK|nr:sulfurtransferase [Chitinasiproducens palmae]SDV50699.1 thiosulfate/3-mercaptopyruvate sulfurtransferase [Chitinasiproducens palmae]